MIGLLGLVGLSLILGFFSFSARAQEEHQQPLIIGYVHDEQNQPVDGAAVRLLQDEEVISETQTQPDGRFALEYSQNAGNELSIQVHRTHFHELTIGIDDSQLQMLMDGDSLVVDDILMQREITAAFWIAAIIFALVLVLIATDKMHNTLAALSGAALLMGISYLGEPITESLYVFDFMGAISYIDWNVIFLVMGMMILIAIIEDTGVFQWLAFFSYRISGGKMLLLLPILMLITGVASAFLDNVTTMLLMTPITVQIAIAAGIPPLALLIPEVMASNVIGVSTLVGTPTNILIGSYANISFNDFLRNLTPGVLLAFIGLIAYSWMIYRKDFADVKEITPVLLERLEERSKIRDVENLKKAGVIGTIMLLLFIFGERIHLLPSVTALLGATSLMVWIRPNIDEMIEAVDWTTLVFFMALFMVVGGIQEVGLISIIARTIGNLVGNSLILTMITVIWVSAILSTVVANIPFTAAMLPVVGFLSATVPGAHSKVLFYCLSVGSAMGGNGSLIGASANMVTAGIAEGAGYPISYAYFLKKGFPALVITVALATIWLLIRFL